jgi:hypothetical protein
MASATTKAKPSAFDRKIEACKKAYQLEQLLNTLYGKPEEFFEEMGRECQETLIWLAADLACDIKAFVESVETAPA